VTESALEQVFETLDLDEKVRLTDTIGEADVVLALRAKLKHSSWVRDVAKLRQLPIYAIKVRLLMSFFVCPWEPEKPMGFGQSYKPISYALGSEAPAIVEHAFHKRWVAAYPP
jgi:hypothetical protein